MVNFHTSFVTVRINKWWVDRTAIREEEAVKDGGKKKQGKIHLASLKSGNFIPDEGWPPWLGVKVFVYVRYFFNLISVNCILYRSSNFNLFYPYEDVLNIYGKGFVVNKPVAFKVRL